MDTNTAEAIETLREDIRRSESALRSEIGQQVSRLRDEMSSMGNELKRHTAMLVESLRDDIRIIAEGVVSVDAKVESLRRNNDPR